MTSNRNDLCECGSGKKYKKCCMNDHTKGPRRLVQIKPTPVSAPASAREPQNVTVGQGETNAAMAIMQMMKHRGALR